MITFPLKTQKDNAAVSPLFGKAKYFAFYDGVELKIEKNPYEKGSQLVNWFLEKGVDKVVIKEMGSKPFNRLIHIDIKILFAGENRVTTNELLEKYNNNQLKELSENELKDIIKEHESNKDSSQSCGSHKSNEGHSSKSCHKKVKASNPYVFL